jgi:flagellar hook protein FlgE
MSHSQRHVFRCLWSFCESDALGIVDNVANSNTVDSKRSRARVPRRSWAVAVGVGGVKLARSQRIFAQGTLQTTRQATDLALSGDGFFVVKDWPRR